MDEDENDSRGLLSGDNADSENPDHFLHRGAVVVDFSDQDEPRNDPRAIYSSSDLDDVRAPTREEEERAIRLATAEKLDEALAQEEATAVDSPVVQDIEMGEIPGRQQRSHSMSRVSIVRKPAPMLAAGSRHKYKWVSTGFGGRYELDLAATARFAMKLARVKKETKPTTRIGQWVEQHHFVVLFLIVLGFLTASLGAGVDYVISLIRWGHWEIYAALDGQAVAQYFAFTSFTVVVVTMAVASVHFISNMAAGSGIPQLRVILSDVWIDGYLGVRTLVAKVLGLIFTSGSGVLQGKEGPFTHVAALIANILCRIPPFRNIRRSPVIRNQMLGAACAAGLSANFGSAVGGVLFAVETTEKYYPMTNYMDAFITATVAGLSSRFYFNYIKHGEMAATALVADYGPTGGTSPFELASFVVIGVIGGLIGAAFVWMHCVLLSLMKRFQPKTARNQAWYRLGYSILVAVLTVSLRFPGIVNFGFILPMDFLRLMFNPTSHGIARVFDSWFEILIWSTIVFALMIFTLAIPVPAGLFVPMLAVGGGVGRVIGEALAARFPDGLLGATIVPDAFAVVTGSALTGGVTHSISTALVVVEMTGRVALMPGVLIAVVTAVLVSSKFTVSIYDALLFKLSLPYTHKPSRRSANMVVADIMKRNVPVVARNTTVGMLKALLQSQPPSVETFAVIDNTRDRVLLGTVQRTQLVLLLPGRAVEYVEGRVVSQYGMSRDTAQPRVSFTDEVPRPSMDRVAERSVEVPITDVCVTLRQNMILFEVDELFSAQKLQFAYVTQAGMLLGMVTREDLSTATQPQAAVKLRAMFARKSIFC